MQGRSLAREFGPAGAASGKLLKATAKKKPASQKLANALPADAFDVVLPTSPTAAVGAAAQEPEEAGSVVPPEPVPDLGLVLRGGSLRDAFEGATGSNAPSSAGSTPRTTLVPGSPTSPIDQPPPPMPALKAADPSLNNGVEEPPRSPLRDRTLSTIRQAQALRRISSGEERAKTASTPSPLAAYVVAEQNVVDLPPPPSPPSGSALPPPPPDVHLFGSPRSARRRSSAAIPPPPPSPPPPSPSLVGRSREKSEAPPPPPSPSPPSRTKSRSASLVQEDILVLDDPLSLEQMIVNSPFLQRCIDFCTKRKENPFKDRNFLQLSPEHLTAVMEKILYSQNSILLSLRFMPAVNDIMIVGHPRCGLTAVSHIVDSLKFGRYTPLMSLPDRVMWPEAIYNTDIPSPGSKRVFRTHLPLKRFFEPHMNKGNAPCKLIVVLRDPLDIRVSWYRVVRRLSKKLAEGNTEPKEFDRCYNLDAFTTMSASVTLEAKEEEMLPEGIYPQLAKVLRNPEVLVVFYEDVVSYPEEAVSEIQRFTGFGSETLVSTVVAGLKKDEAHPMRKRRVGASGTGASLFSKASQRRIDAHWDRLVTPTTKQASYEALFEAIKGREYPYGNRRRLLDEDLKNSAKGGMLKGGGSFNHLMSAGGAQLRRATNLDAASPTPRSSFFGMVRRASWKTPGAGGGGSETITPPTGGGESKSRPSSLILTGSLISSSSAKPSSLEKIDPDESDDESAELQSWKPL